jgi:putative methyltransferase (TIGR04325 family)
MTLFRSTLLGKSLKKIAHYLSVRVQNAGKYIFAELEYVPGGWHATTGWNDPGIADAQEKHWPILVRNLQGPGPLGVAHFPWHTTREDRADHNVMMSYGYVLALAARKKDTLSILDWGGGTGHYYLYSKSLLPEIGIDYHCYDVANLCGIARQLLPTIRVSDDESEFLGQTYDLVVTSSSLHYFEDWRGEVRKLAGATREFLYVSRLQTVMRVPSFVAMHKAMQMGYGEFLCWWINRQELIACVEECGLDLVREFVYYDKSIIRGAPEKGDCRGFLFCRKSISGGRT